MIDQGIVTQALQLISTRRGVTFVELAELLGDRARGEFSIEYESLPNVLLWVGMSDDFVELVNALRATGQVQMDATVPLVYLIDGGIPNLPHRETASEARLSAAPLGPGRVQPVSTTQKQAADLHDQ
jgi:hypothetical protein